MVNLTVWDLELNNKCRDGKRLVVFSKFFMNLEKIVLYHTYSNGNLEQDFNWIKTKKDINHSLQSV